MPETGRGVSASRVGAPYISRRHARFPIPYCVLSVSEGSSRFPTNGTAVHLRHERPAQGGSTFARDPRRHLALVLPRREDRRPRPQRRRKILAAAHHGTRVGFLPQEPALDPSKTVQGNVEEAVAAQRALLKEFEDISMAFAEPMDDKAMEKLLDRQAKVQEQIDAHDLWNLDNKIEVAMDALRLPPADAEVTNLSGGERRRVALCRVLLSEPDMLLLDEPTNHLDAESVAWLEHHLEAFPGTVVAITHDRYFLDNVAKWILELDRGRGVPYEGNYSGWLEQKSTRMAQEEKQASARQRTLTRELEWVRMSPRARQSKSKARIQKYERLLAEEQDVKLDTVEIHIPAGPRLGDTVVVADHVAKGFGDHL